MGNRENAWAKRLCEKLQGLGAKKYKAVMIAYGVFCGVAAWALISTSDALFKGDSTVGWTLIILCFLLIFAPSYLRRIGGIEIRPQRLSMALAIAVCMLVDAVLIWGVGVGKGMFALLFGL